MTYLTENPWPLAILLAIVAMFFGWLALRSGQEKHRKIAIIIALLAVVPFITDQLITTDREAITRTLFELRDAVVSGNAQAALAFVDGGENIPGSTAEQVQRGMDLVNVHDDMRLKSIQVEASGGKATAEFRANGTIDVKNVATERYAPTRWRLTWVKRADDWKITVVERLDPLKGEVIDVFASQ